MASIVEIPLNAVPAQEFTVTLGSQNCTISIFSAPNTTSSTGYSLYCNLYVGTQTIILGVRAVMGSYINLYNNPNFSGYLFFYTDNEEDPTEYSLLGATYHLYYADYDALAYDYENWVNNNESSLASTFGNA